MEKIRFGVVGLGDMGFKHCQTIIENVEEAELCAVATGSGANVERLHAIPGGEKVAVFRTPQEMFDSGLVDAVLIASVHREHVAQAKAAFAAGLHVLLEKPMGVTTKEVRELNAAAQASGKAFGAMFNQRTNPVYQKMHDIVASGELGGIRRTNVIITDWFRAQSYYDSGAWRATWKKDGGGVLLNQAPHNLDLWQWICGMPVRVRAFCGLGRWHDIEVEDDVTAYVEYENGATGCFVTCTGEAPGTNRFEISLDGGQLVYEHDKLTLTRLATPAGEFIREYQGGYGKPDMTVEDITPTGENPMHAGIIRTFARHILFGEPLVATGYEGINSLMLSNGMLLSGWTGETVELPFDDEKFAAMLEERAAHSREKVAKKIVMDLSKSY